MMLTLLSRLIFKIQKMNGIASLRKVVLKPTQFSQPTQVGFGKIIKRMNHFNR